MSKLSLVSLPSLALLASVGWFFCWKPSWMLHQLPLLRFQLVSFSPPNFRLRSPTWLRFPKNDLVSFALILLLLLVLFRVWRNLGHEFQTFFPLWKPKTLRSLSTWLQWRPSLRPYLLGTFCNFPKFWLAYQVFARKNFAGLLNSIFLPPLPIWVRSTWLKRLQFFFSFSTLSLDFL